MTEENTRYQVLLTGKIIEGFEKEQALNDLTRLFKIDIEKASAIIARAPIVVKKDLDAQTAKKYGLALKKSGLECKVSLMQDSTSDAAEAVASASNSQAESADYQTSNDMAETAINPIVEPEKYLGLSYRIEGRPDYGYLNVTIPANQTLKVEASAMAAMDTHITMKTKFKGGLGRFLTGESIFINEFTAEHADAEIGIAPATPGDLAHEYLDGNTIYLQNSAYVASSAGVNVESKWQGMIKGFFSGENLFLIRCSGQGDLWFNTYGAMIEIDVTDNYVVDTGNIVAFTESLDYKITKVGGYKSLFFSGEGFVCRFSGTGKVWIQTRSASGFAAWARMFRPAG